MLAQCLGTAAVRAGHSVVFTRADALFQELLQARADRTFGKAFRRFLAPELLVLDDFGLQRLSAQQSQHLIRADHREAARLLPADLLIAPVEKRPD